MNDILINIFMALVLLTWIKSVVIGSNFSLYNFFKYKEDYSLWYSKRQKYIPPHERKHFSKKNK